MLERIFSSLFSTSEKSAKWSNAAYSSEKHRRPKEQTPDTAPKLLLPAFHAYLEWLKYLTPQEAGRRLRELILAATQSFHQESVGHFHPELMPPLEIDARGRVFITTPHYPTKQQMLIYFAEWQQRIHQDPVLASMMGTPAFEALVERYTQEIKQIVEIHAWLLDQRQEYFSILGKVATPEELQKYGLEQHALTITPALHPFLPHLEVGSTIQVWMTKSLVTISPPSRFHLNGETSFAWVSRLVYLPDSGTWHLLQEGLFGGWQAEDLAILTKARGEKAQFAWKEPMAADISTAQILEKIVDLLEGLPLGPSILKKRKNTKRHTWKELTELKNPPVTPPELIESMAQLIEWEAEQLHTGRSTMREISNTLTGEIEETFRQAVTEEGKDCNWEGILERYAQQHTTQDGRKKSLGLASAGLAPALKGYNWSSILECAISPQSLLSHLNTAAGSGQLFTPFQLDVLNKFGKNKLQIKNQTELKKICKELKLNSTDFTPGNEKECRTCQTKNTYLGPCQICPYCNFGFNQEGQELPQPIKSELNEPLKRPKFAEQKPAFKLPVATLTDVFSGEDSRRCKDCIPLPLAA